MLKLDEKQNNFILYASTLHCRIVSDGDVGGQTAFWTPNAIGKRSVVASFQYAQTPFPQTSSPKQPNQKFYDEVRYNRSNHTDHSQKKSVHVV